jgi:hypothetical protein
MTFGSYRGQPPGEIPDRSLRWALGGDNLWSWLRKAIEEKLRRRLMLVTTILSTTPPRAASSPCSRCRQDSGDRLVLSEAYEPHAPSR